MPEKIPDIKILFEDYYLMVVSKPAGLMVENDLYGNPSLEKCTLMHLQKKFPSNKEHYIAFPHRIDRVTEGIVVIAKTQTSLRVLSHQFEIRSVSKIYYALTAKLPLHKSGALKHYLKKDTKEKKAVILKNERSGYKTCELKYDVEGETTKNHSVIKIELLTGRFHQVRAQFAYEGMPLIGDKKYGSGVEYPENGIALIAKSILFNHPKTGEELFFEIPFPKNKYWDKKVNR